MGRELCRSALEEKDFELVGGTVEPSTEEAGADLGELCGMGKAGATATEKLPEDAEVLIEFTTPEATVAHLSYEQPVVIGTTGLSGEQRTKVAETAEKKPVVLAPNMSVGVNLLRGIVRELSGKLGVEYDIELVESHHRNKLDAPSGTALLLARAAAEGWGRELEEVAVLRAGKAGNRGGKVRSGSTPCGEGRS